ncbi:pyridoxal phosphate-dependent aminotransferase [Clostridium felsineum]|uniref:pyridoxal phosphate-dependent aminotransferase n=1 Tax=Clostridium felsineum TaxID=36839 RepID=UPI00098C2A39|nr:histidinol-phosphate transaminase [Clostridium felsineum]URZ15886.1 Threonine-phosphate decarboxylase [Clostridium felsineum DSM 794]
MIHGGDIYTEGVFKGKELIDYSSNINPLGVPKTFLSNINEAVKNLEVYPDVSYRKINKSIENYLKIKNMGIVLGNGASEIIELSVSLFKRILIVVPSYIEYEINARRHNVDIIYSYLNNDMDIDYEDIMSKLKDVEAIIIGNPNNPNGGIINKDKFKYILNFAEKNKKTIIIDEAFVEFTGNTNFSFTQEAEQYNCLFIIRAMTKFFAMPGIRFGYGITKNKEIINKIKEKQNPWNINCFAEIAAIKCLSDKKYIEESLLWIKSARGNFINELHDISFIEKVFYPHANFVLIKLKKITGETLYELLLQEGFVIRRAENFKGLDDSFVRFAIKDDRLNESFIKVLKGVEGKI